MQYEIGDDNECNTQTRGNGQITDNVNFDEEQREETECVGNQRQHARDIKCTECQTGSGDRIKTFRSLYCDSVYNLHAVADTNGKNKERHKYRIRVQPVA